MTQASKLEEIVEKMKDIPEDKRKEVFDQMMKKKAPEAIATEKLKIPDETSSTSSAMFSQPKQQISPEIAAQQEEIEIIGKLTGEDLKYFRKLTFQERNLTYHLGVLELEKTEVIERLRDNRKEQVQFHNQLQEKYELPQGIQCQVDLQTGDIFHQKTPQAVAVEG